MHHESEQSQELKDFFHQLTERAEQAELGATDRFPDGKLTENDEGEIVFEVTAYKDKVVVNFGTPVASLGMTPQQALRLAILLRRHARQIRSPQQRKYKRIGKNHRRR